MILTADAETYYNSKTKYSLRNMGTEEYVLDPQFEVHGWAVKIDQGPSEWLTHKEAVRFFAGIDWNRTVFVAHKAMFDGAILAWRYGHIAKGYIDTLGLGNAYIRAYTGYVSLDKCAEYLGLPLKSGVLGEVNGKRTHEILEHQGLWEQLGAYACQDNENCYAIMRQFYRLMSLIERVRMDWSVRNYVRGRLRIDVAKLHEAYNSVTGERDRLLEEAGIDAATARSRAKFAAYLESIGIEVDTKEGKNNAEIPAIAKNDPFVQQLLLDGDPAAVAAMKARLAFASTIEVSRAERLLKMARATKGKMLIPTTYHAAHTGRPGGTDGVNPANFRKSTKERRSLLREAIVPPKGKVLVDVDASQVEARICAWMAGCEPLMEAFNDPNRDAYCEYGTNILYNREITRADELERQVCKVEVLSLQYQVGGVTLCKRLQAVGIEIDLEEAHEHVKAYRTGYPEILENGKVFGELLKRCVQEDAEFEHKGCLLTSQGIQLPSKRWLLYDRMSINGRQLVYYSWRYKTWQTLFPGAINENLAQSMANDIVGAIQAKYIDTCVNMLYDSVVLLEDNDVAEDKAEEVRQAMCVAPEWAKLVTDVPLPLMAEAKLKPHW